MDRHYLQLFVALVSELYRLSAGLLNFQLEDARVFLPAALRKAFLHVGQSGQSRFAFAQAILCVGLPIESCICLRTIHLSELVEFCLSLFVALIIQSFSAVFVQFLQAVELFLFAVAGFLLTIALFLFSITSFLFAVAALLLFVLGILRVLRTIPVGERNGRQPRGARACGR